MPVGRKFDDVSGRWWRCEREEMLLFGMLLYDPFLHFNCYFHDFPFCLYTLTSFLRFCGNLWKNEYKKQCTAQEISSYKTVQSGHSLSTGWSMTEVQQCHSAGCYHSATTLLYSYRSNYEIEILLLNRFVCKGSCSKTEVWLYYTSVYPYYNILPSPSKKPWDMQNYEVFRWGN